jgi:uridine phosphorylase
LPDAIYSRNRSHPKSRSKHLSPKLKTRNVAETIITVGDPDRVGEVSKHFDRIDFKKGKREFITHTGWISNKRITVISTGIGTDNIDIVLNELDALVNVDFETRLIKDQLTSLNIIRIGTSGSLHADIPMDSILVSDYGLGFDALMNYYRAENTNSEVELLNSVKSYLADTKIPQPYLSQGSSTLMEKIGFGLMHGITATAPGFYAPQGREVRAKNAVPEFLNRLKTFKFEEQRITNLEMETAGIYALAKALGHEALSVNAILASRAELKFSKNPLKTVDAAIQLVLERL